MHLEHHVLQHVVAYSKLISLYALT